MNVQRQVIYEQRRRVLEGEDLSEDIGDWIDELVERVVVEHTASEYQEEWDVDSLFKEMADLYDPKIQPDEFDLAVTQAELIGEFQDDARDAYEAKQEELGAELMREIERFLILQIVDLRWREHLDAMDYLRDGIHLRAMAQKDPLVEYRAEGHAMFEELGGTIREEVVLTLFHAQIEVEPEQLEPQQGNGNLVFEHETAAGAEVISAAGLRRERRADGTCGATGRCDHL